MNSDDKGETGTTKTTSEKPVSLYPLGFEDALKSLMQVPPPPKGKKSKQKRAKTRGK
jgi:hypothetical protein